MVSASSNGVDPEEKSSDQYPGISKQLKKAEPAEIQEVGQVVCELLEIMRRLRAPDGCPWDQEQTHESIRLHAVEEVYEMIDAIEAGDDEELCEELGDLLLQVIFHSRLGEERGVFDFIQVTQAISEKLIRRHPHVFGDVEVEDVDAVWKQWESIKRKEKEGSHRERVSALDGIPKGLNGLQRAQKALKKAQKAGLVQPDTDDQYLKNVESNSSDIGKNLMHWIKIAQLNGINAEAALREEINRHETIWRQKEAEMNAS
jgi:MazG family protein